jgi:hypothetical protein
VYHSRGNRQKQHQLGHHQNTESTAGVSYMRKLHQWKWYAAFMIPVALGSAALAQAMMAETSGTGSGTTEASACANAIRYAPTPTYQVPYYCNSLIPMEREKRSECRDITYSRYESKCSVCSESTNQFSISAGQRWTCTAQVKWARNN